MNTTEIVVEIRPEKKIQVRTGFTPMTSAISVQRSWVQIPYGPEFFSGVISTTISVVFIAVRISYIRFYNFI